MSAVNTKDWSEVKVGDLFEVSRPPARVKIGYLEGETPFVSTSSSNNGVSEWVDAGEEELEAGECITVSALDGTAFWQPQSFLGRGGAGSSISILRRRGITELSGLFLASVITAACQANYNSMLSGSKLRGVVLHLPTTDIGEPDWQFMESIMSVKLMQAKSNLDALSSILNSG